MTLVAPPLLTRSELIDASILLVRRHLADVVRSSLPVLLPVAAVDLVLDFGAPDVATLALPVTLMMWGLVEGMAIASFWDLLNGNPTTAARSWKMVSGRVWAVTVGYSLKWLLISVGFVFLIVPGLFLIGRFFAVSIVSIAEQASLPDAFRRSGELSRTNLHRIIWTLGMLEFGTMIIGIAIAFLVPGSEAETPSALQNLLHWVVALAVLPVRAALTTLLYLDIRTRREGYDLQTVLSGLARDA